MNAKSQTFADGSQWRPWHPQSQCIQCEHVQLAAGDGGLRTLDGNGLPTCIDLPSLAAPPLRDRLRRTAVVDPLSAAGQPCAYGVDAGSQQTGSDLGFLKMTPLGGVAPSSSRSPTQLSSAAVSAACVSRRARWMPTQ